MANEHTPFSLGFWYHPRLHGRRRRMEHPYNDETLCQQYLRAPPTVVTPQALAATRLVMNEEIARVDRFHAIRQNVHTFPRMTLAGEPEYDELIRTLYLRGRLQSSVWDVYEILTIRGYIDPKCLSRPMSIATGSRDASSLANLLSCFEYPNTCGTRESLGSMYDGLFQEHLIWLAVMIIRGCADIPAVLETIETRGLLGEMNEEKYLRYVQDVWPQRYICNPEELVPQRSNRRHVLGFWLPHGIVAADQAEFDVKVRQHLERFNRIEAAYKAYFDLPDSELLLEKDQASYHREHPEVLIETLRRSGRERPSAGVVVSHYLGV